MQTAASIEKLTAEQRAKIDELGELERQFELLKPRNDRLQALRSDIKGWFPDVPADQPYVLSGNLYELQFSARRQESAWKNKLLVWKKLGGVKALALWDVTYKAVKEALGEAVAEGLQVKTRTGYRTMAAVLKAPVAPGPAVEAAAAAVHQARPKAA